METSIAVLSVPLIEWTALKSQMNDITKSLIELKGKNKPEFLTPKECCELLKCSRNTFQSYIDKGFLQAIKMNVDKKYSKVLIKRIDVDYFIETKNARRGANN